MAQRWRYSATVLVLAMTAGCAGTAPGLPASECPQPRFTERAPAEFLALRSPLPAAADSARGRALYRATDSNGCALCHGENGDGHGVLASQFSPPPRNFACKATVSGIPDGQLFWIIRNGSPGTAMPAHLSLGDDDLWHLVHYLRTLAR